MFTRARLKLTAWYLAIIMLISIAFSMAFYHLAVGEMHRIVREQELRRERLDELFYPFRPPQTPDIYPRGLEEAESRLKMILFLINSAILSLAGAGGYFLAGRTLRPIKKMLDEQHRFISDASHELRTPLTALRSELEASLLEKKLSVKEAKALVASNLEEVINLQTLSDNLLKLTRLENNSRTQLFTSVSLLQIIEDVLKKIAPLARKKKITISNEVDDVNILGSAPDLHQLFIIILDNAIKYSADGKTVAITSRTYDHQVEVSIKDEGVGINEADLPHVFDRFYRSDKSRTRNDISGYGLGLSIAKKIVEEHKGSISIRSFPDDGTTVFIKLPAVALLS